MAIAVFLTLNEGNESFKKKIEKIKTENNFNAPTLGVV